MGPKRKAEPAAEASASKISKEHHDEHHSEGAENQSKKVPMSYNVVPRLNHPAPAFGPVQAVVNKQFKDVKLSDYKGKWVVLFFYPLDFTFVCPTEIIAYSELAEDFRKINCEVVGVSIDSKFSHLAWINQSRDNGGLGEMKIPLIADVTKDISKAYGVLKEDEGIAYRGTFIIDPKQNLRQITINDLDVGRNVEEVRTSFNVEKCCNQLKHIQTKRLVEACQFHDEHGDVCPANWKKGAKSMKPDVVGSKEYFQATYSK
ncbi:thioredoxin-like protein [Chytriomyces sp. MP71]|nr:thioredoxin-like protein [Chytriomyces sp. MP71]